MLLGTGLLVFQGHWSQWHAVQEFMVAVGSVLILVPPSLQAAWRSCY